MLLTLTDVMLRKFYSKSISYTMLSDFKACYIGNSYLVEIWHQIVYIIRILSYFAMGYLSNYCTNASLSTKTIFKLNILDFSIFHFSRLN